MVGKSHTVTTPRKFQVRIRSNDIFSSHDLEKFLKEGHGGEVGRRNLPVVSVVDIDHKPCSPA